jgi:phage gp36-like protein
MSYCTQAQIETAIPATHLNDALDDDRDGAADADVLANIISSAEQAVDSFLAGLFAVPFITPPAPVKEAAFVFACERIYDRRQILEKNPFKDRADFWRKRLEQIGAGELPLDSATDAAFTPGAVVTENAVVNGTMR